MWTSVDFNLIFLLASLHPKITWEDSRESICIVSLGEWILFVRASWNANVLPIILLYYTSCIYYTSLYTNLCFKTTW